MVVGVPGRKTTGSSGPAPGTLRTFNKHQMDFAKIYLAMQKGHKVCKINVLKKWDPAYKLLTLNMETRQLFLTKLEQTAVRRPHTNSIRRLAPLQHICDKHCAPGEMRSTFFIIFLISCQEHCLSIHLKPLMSSKPTLLDLRHVREVQTLDYKLSAIQIGDKWKRDREIQNFDPLKILVISYGTQFTLKEWTLLCICDPIESSEACRLWNEGVHNLMLDTRDRFSSSHTARIERFIAKHFYNLVTPGSEFVARKHMKPFVQTSLQYKVSSRQLQEVTEDQMNLLQFSKATRNFIHSHPVRPNAIFSGSPRITNIFSCSCRDGTTITFVSFMRFLENMQRDEMISNRARVVDFLRSCDGRALPFCYGGKFLFCSYLEIGTQESGFQFCDFLFSRENSIWDSMNEKVIQDMTRPLSHYWIASSHNTYVSDWRPAAFRVFTGLICTSSSHGLPLHRVLIGKGVKGVEIVGINQCTLLTTAQFDVLLAVDCWDGQRKPNSQEYPVILSIEDNCSVPAQRLLAQEIKEILGDDLLTQPINASETELPSPAALKKKIILKHKKLPIESEDLATFVSASTDEFQDTDILARECIKKGVLSLMDSVRHEWSSHVFVLFPDRLCYLLQTCDDTSMKDDTISMIGDDDREVTLLLLIIAESDEGLAGFGVRPEEQHITEEWFHGHCERDEAKERILQHKDKGNGLFMVRDSNLFIGDYSLTILHDGKVHHVRIKTRIIDKEKKYYFMDNKVCDTLYELVSYYTRHYLTTPTFKMVLTTPCPQPQPHLDQPWFSATADKEKAEALLSQVPEDGAFLLRYSSSDKSVFVLSIRVDGEIWHYRLKRDGRIFVVNQTVFENLNQIVEYYRSREFVRGISLRFPVNENEITTIPAHIEIARGSYQELSQLEEKVRYLHWFSATADKEKAEALLSQVPEDGAFLLRYSSSDKSVFVLSIRVDGEIWHYRLKRDGRIFVVNQTVFENLNQIVEYYRSREFVRGISLRFPVNENEITTIPAHIEIARGSYQELSQLEEKVMARALRPYRGTGDDDLSFPANAIITVMARALRPYRGTGDDDLSFPANAIITVLRKEEALWTGYTEKHLKKSSHEKRGLS
ncbi:unnamed protein product [Strongylus vulgaris]|uniref:phosphoinositide phospholipase C n=1 Tax=Strongylus vulgaris TaxID=40348 RepID=A0A3P7JFX0_STRVU|nr:unnamed protein product [Strongylus vulgaris]